MSAYLLCLTCNGGVPLFTRKHGDLKQIPFPLLASLNGVALFGESHDVTLIKTETEDCKVVWRDYHNSIRLILAAPNDVLSDLHLHRLLDTIFQAMVLLVGLDDLIAQRSVDRVKRDLRSSFCLIDALLSALKPGSERLGTVGDLVGAADCVAFPEANVVQNFLDGYVESVDSTYGSVLLHGKIVAATKNWFFLHPDEIALLSAYATADSWATIKDTPVFLPVKSPTVPFRLVTSELVAGVTVCVLCGPAPSLVEIETELLKNWKTTYNLVASLQSLHPRGFPPQIQIDPNILGFIFVNLEKRRVLSSMSPAPVPSSVQHKQHADVSARLATLRTFYRHTVGAVFPDTFIPTPHAVDRNGELVSVNVSHADLTHPVSESYMSYEHHTCVAVQHQQHQLFAVFIQGIPNHSMRCIMHRTLQQLTKDKAFNIVR